jgi:outer membrane protein TolC
MCPSIVSVPRVVAAHRGDLPFRSLTAALLLLWVLPGAASAQSGSVVATETTQPGATTSVNTVSPSILVTGSYAGSVNAKQPLAGPLTLRDAVQRGLEYNLGTVDVAQAVRLARSQQTIARSSLLPNLVGDLTSTWEQLNLAATGFALPQVANLGFTIPSVVGPFSFTDFRARLSQRVVSLSDLNNYRAAKETVRASELTEADTRELVVLAVGGTYLQVAAARARVDSARVQLETANTLLQQARDRRGVGLIAQVDLDRSEIQALAQQQLLTSLQNDLAKQKINLMRLIGLPPTDQYELADTVPFSPPPAVTVDAAVSQAKEGRADLKAAEARVRSSERTLAANRAERLPSVSVNADYGRLGSSLTDLQPTFTVVGRVSVPIWQGGRVEGDVAQAEALVAQRRAELEDVTSQVEAEVRKAFLDLQASASQVGVAQRNLTVTREALDLTRQRFDVGVSDNVEVVQAQEAVATAELDYINSIFAHNVAKLNLARSTGQAATHLAEFLKLP